MTDKKFGLIIPKRVDKFKMRTKSIFDDESDEEEKQSKRPKIPQKKIDVKKKLKEESLEDPSIYEYDSIYDDMKAKEAESIAPKVKKNSRYIDTLLKAADKRKKEYERRIDKKIQAEREKEGDLYKDKEAFVTLSYKKKLQEKEEEEERERRENMLNDMMDITKQKDLSGFYRHFLKQTVGEEKVPEFGEKYIKKEINSPERVVENSKDNANFDHPNIDEDSDGVEIDSDDENKGTFSSAELSNKAQATTSQYNKEIKVQKIKAESRNVMKDKSKFSAEEKTIKTYNKKDSDISSLDSDSNSNEDGNNEKRVTQSDVIESNETNIQRPRHDSSSDDEVNKTDNFKEQNKPVKKNRYSIYEKRTVGDAFIAAQARYFQRMALKNEK